jgi:signal peptidase II
VVPITVAATVAIAVLLFRYKRHTFFSYATSALLIAGGIGNLIDRIAYGFVVDFIHVLFFDYIFNFADCCITVGAVLFVIHVLFFTRSEEDTKGKEEP